MVSQLIVTGAQHPLHGSIPLPCDEPVLVARIALASLCRGRTTLRAKGVQEEGRCVLAALSCFGIQCSLDADEVVVHGGGLTGWGAPKDVLDLRGQSHAAALILALSVSRPFPVELLVDRTVAELLVPTLKEAHPLSAEPLESGQGVFVRCEAVPEGRRAVGISVLTHGVFPWVKQAILLAGLRATSPTVVEEKIASADHLERALLRVRVPFSGEGTISILHPPRDADALAPQIYDPIGSAALSAPLCAAVAVVPGSRVVIRERLQNPSRNDFVQAAKWMGLGVRQQPSGDRQGEPIGQVEVSEAALRAVSLSGEIVLRLGDEAAFLLPLLAMADGQSSLSDWVARGRGGDSRFLARAVGFLRSAGIEASTESQVTVRGRPRNQWRPLVVTTGGDPRLALLATILALGATGTSVIDDVDCLAGHFPRWVGTLRALGAAIEVKTA